MTSLLRTVDLFAGCGGMTLGCQRAGLNVVAAADHWKPAIETYRANFDHPMMEHDLSDSEATVALMAPFRPDVVVGGPPCQDFSSAGRRDESRGRAGLSMAFALTAVALSPRFIIMENVAAITRSPVFTQVCDIFRQHGYGLSIRVLDAAYCGVPQHRKRMFIIAGRNCPEGFVDDALDTGLADHPLSLREYFGNSLGIDHYFRAPTNYSRRGVFSVDEPSTTIRGTDRPIPPGYPGHPGDSAPLDQVRRLSVSERAQIQTFPQDFRFVGAATNQHAMIGNAVPVNLAQYVASVIVSYAGTVAP